MSLCTAGTAAAGALTRTGLLDRLVFWAVVACKFSHDPDQTIQKCKENLYRKSGHEGYRTRRQLGRQTRHLGRGRRSGKEVALVKKQTYRRARNHPQQDARPISCNPTGCERKVLEPSITCADNPYTCAEQSKGES